MPRFNNAAALTQEPINNSMPIPGQYRNSRDFLKANLPFEPEIMLILGSGLGFMADAIQDAVIIPYNEIPNFKSSTAPGHMGRLVAGRLSGRNVLAMQGRFHVYEGYTPEESAYPVRAASLLGVKKIIITCACGGVNKDYNVGDLVLINDYINLTHPGPLVGFDISGFDTRFIDMSQVFDKEYRDAANKAAAKKNIVLRNGTYFYMTGPQFETPAEIRAIGNLGGDLVGMSLVHEAIMAARCEMRLLALGLVTNMAAGISGEKLSEDEVLREGSKASGRFSELVLAILEKM